MSQIEHKTMYQIALEYIDTIDAQQKEIEDLKNQLRIARESCLYTPPMKELTKQDFINVLESELNNNTIYREVSWNTIAEYALENSIELDIYQVYNLEEIALEMCKKYNIIPKTITRVEPYVHTINTYPELILKQLIVNYRKVHVVNLESLINNY